MNENNIQISEGRGPFHTYWRMRTLAAFGGVPADSQRAS